MLTVINSNGAITEVDLDKYNKKELRIGRDGSQCDIVIADPIVSKVHGMIHLERSYLMYRDEDSSNGTFWENGGGRKLLSKRDGFVDIFDQTVLRIGNVNNPDEMVLLLYQNSDERKTGNGYLWMDRWYGLVVIRKTRLYFGIREYPRDIA